MILGKEGIAKRQRKQEIEHEQELARIRAQSHALVWTGTEGQLIEEVKKLFDAELLRANDLSDALQKATIHFVGLDGNPIIKPISAKPTKPRTAESISRREFVEPLLDAKGWSILDWANEAEISHATAIDYLDKKTKPYRSTRLKLAKALGIDVEQLPK